MKWFCPNCGTENDGGFCANCGTPESAARVPDHMKPIGYNGAELYEAHLALEKQKKQKKSLTVALVVMGAIIGAFVLFFGLMMIIGMTASDDAPVTSAPAPASAPATITPTETPEPEPEVFMGYMSKLGAKAYLDVVSVEPAVGVSLKVNGMEAKMYDEVVCACGTADGATEYISIKVEDYNAYIDSTANVTDVDSISFQKVEFSPAKRIVGKVVSSETTEGLKDQIGMPKMLEFESIQ